MNNWISISSAEATGSVTALVVAAVAKTYLWPRFRRKFNGGADLTGLWKITHVGLADDGEGEDACWEQTAQLKQFRRE